MGKGIVYLVGAGPGDPGLLTLRGRACLARADVVLYDYLAPAELLRFAPPAAERIFAGKHGAGPHLLDQEEINGLLVERAEQGLCVVRLKGGDPMVFGRGGEEAEVLAAAGIDFEVVPGVSSAFAVPAYAGIPVTHRDWVSGVTILTGHEAPDKLRERVRWEFVARAGNTIVLLMGLTQMRRNLEALMEFGLDSATPAAAICRGATPRQETVVATVADLAALVDDRDLKPPVTVVIGDVVRLRPSIAWLESRPLFGRRVVVTRPQHQAPRLASLLFEQGAEVLECPTISIEDLDPAPLQAAIEILDQYHLLVLTSVNGVERFFAELERSGRDVRALGGTKVAAIGPGTAESLARRQVRADFVPEEYRAEGLLVALSGLSLDGRRVLLPRAEGAREILPEELRKRGAAVDEIRTYRAVMPPGAVSKWEEILQRGKPDCVTLTSSSAATNFLRVVDSAGQGCGREALASTRIACIGPVTARTVRDAGLECHIQPAEYTIPGLSEAVAEYFVDRSG